MEVFDPFAVLGLPRRYDVDSGALERAYLERSAALHPDMVGEAGLSLLGEDAADAGQKAADLNRARQMLEDPESRAVALWRLWGGGGVDDRALPPGFLVEMMETREQIEASRGASDPAETAKWEAWAVARRREHEKTVGVLFAQLAPGSAANAGLLRQIKLELNAWRYIERLVEQLAE